MPDSPHLKLRSAFVAIFIAALFVAASRTVLAVRSFSGAEGWGAITVGGRGGVCKGAVPHIYYGAETGDLQTLVFVVEGGMPRDVTLKCRAEPSKTGNGAHPANRLRSASQTGETELDEFELV